MEKLTNQKIKTKKRKEIAVAAVNCSACRTLVPIKLLLVARCEASPSVADSY